jgi:ribonuclease M5
MKPQINKIIVVEGRDDESAVKGAVDAEVIVTNGFAISPATWRLIEKAYHGPGIIVFTDPDYAGDNIRKRIEERFPLCSHSHLSKEDARKDDDIGIENARVDNIIKALEKAAPFVKEKKTVFSIEDLERFGLVGRGHSAERRAIMGRALGLGTCNGKTFLARLNGYNISREEYYLHGQALFASHSEKNNK